MECISTAKYQYHLRTDTRTDDDGTIVPVYGIEVYEDGVTAPIISLPDLFTRLSQAEELVKLCNHLELDPVHLTAVVEDALLPS